MDANDAQGSAVAERLARVFLLRLLLLPAAIVAIFLLGMAGAEADEGGEQPASEDVAVDQGRSQADQEPAQAEEPAEESSPESKQEPKPEPAPAQQPESTPQDEPADEESNPSDHASEPASEPARGDDESGESPYIQGETESDTVVTPTVENADELAANKPARAKRAVTRTAAESASALRSDGTFDRRGGDLAEDATTPLVEETARTVDDVRTFTQREVWILADGTRELTSTLLEDRSSTPDDGSSSPEPEPVHDRRDRAVAVLPMRLEQTSGTEAVPSGAAWQDAVAAPPGPTQHVTGSDAGHESMGTAPTASSGEASVAAGSGGAGAPTVATGTEAALLAAAGTAPLLWLDDWHPHAVDRHPGFSPD